MGKTAAPAEDAPVDDVPPLEPVTVEYCPRCGMPFDFCDFGDKWETGECRTESSRRYPEIFGSAEEVAEQLLKISVSPPTVQRKKKPEARQEVTIQRSTRSKRKVVTTVTGLHLFGVKLEAAAKLFAKQFASGAGVVKGIPGQMDHIDCQGDVEDQVIELILAQYPDITEEHISSLHSRLVAGNRIKRMRGIISDVGKRAFGSVTPASRAAPAHATTGSKYESSKCLANVYPVEGIWRAPRKLAFTKEDFDRAYPPSYNKMRIGLPDSGTFHAQYIDPKFDEMSPLVWSTILMAPIIIWGGIETYYHYFPAKPGSHH
ncbi:translation initiation factor SUI1 family protein [Babesia ovis]|uniref:Translation initiation factor SUI1 family protein n=1 Tax=Babesia ovis TaxID=5869 RepID=A0A9W5TAH4_BABOV|nr:translation initiation factor SUI1 family protein [Babesia ovis]